MPLSLDDMAPSQRRLLARLCGPDLPVEAIGCELSELSDPELLTARGMIPLGLVEVVEGWRSTEWLMLTGYAQRLLEEGLAN